MVVKFRYDSFGVAQDLRDNRGSCTVREEIRREGMSEGMGRTFDACTLEELRHASPPTADRRGKLGLSRPKVILARVQLAECSDQAWRQWKPHGGFSLF